jgi:hypothetical protein
MFIIAKAIPKQSYFINCSFHNVTLYHVHKKAAKAGSNSGISG